MTREVTALSETDRKAVFEVINAAAEMYEGSIPEESDTTPYMSMGELEAEMERIQFYGDVRDRLAGVIGIQERPSVSLIRHLYVRPEHQRRGIGTGLLEAGIERTDSPTVLVGTWAAAEWAVDFYESNGFENLGADMELLSEYWDVPEYQRAASVVLRYEKGD
jgi:GNAT superfamily N-acetyltransferase